MKRLSLTAALLLAATWIASRPDTVTGCAAAPRHGERVDTSDEGALIVWDEKTKTEHFIRRANFRSTGYDFGFLVPTPNRPELDVANDDLFSELASITVPKVEHREVVREVEKEFAFGCSRKNETFAHVGAAMPEGKSAAPGGVEVLEQKRVGDYDATVLAFRKGDGDTPERGAAELEKWLVTHGYESPPAVKQWLAKYVQDGWCSTAFKDRGAPGVGGRVAGGAPADHRQSRAHRCRHAVVALGGVRRRARGAGARKPDPLARVPPRAGLRLPPMSG